MKFEAQTHEVVHLEGLSRLHSELGQLVDPSSIQIDCP